ncbi:MAG: GGDEF domain-containing protein [Alphaproteobacteria bacterium]|nr:MAG: GGDEF domain-containing protein [Alphaproteobacteria bacterium]
MDLELNDDPQHDFDASLYVARKVLYTAASMRLPVNPKVYRVLYETECGSYETLKRLRDEMKAHPSDTDVVEIENLHDRVFDANSGFQGLSDISDRLSDEMRQVGSMVQNRLGDDESYIDSLNEARRSFGMFTRAAEAKRVIADLVAESQQHAARTAEFMSQLEEKQRQIGELQHELNELRNRVNIDHLTGIYNRRYFDEKLAQEIEIARTEHRPLSLALCDLDHFKRLNDSWGHSVGDSVLKHFAAIMRNNTKGKDTVARYGGEEFAVILPDTALRDARSVMETIRQVVYSRNFIATSSKQRIGHISASFGVTALRPDDTLESFITRADELLYEAKNRGRNNVAADLASGHAGAAAPAQKAV